MRARGLRVGVMKPADTVDSQDAQALALAVGSTLPMDLICPYRHTAMSATVNAPDLAHIAECFGKIATQNDVVIVESSDLIDFVDLAATLDLELILIVGNRTGHTDAATLIHQICETRGLKTAGYILCDCDPTPTVDDSPQQIKASYLGRMRHREPLARTIVERLL